jgi:hypothetical protein
MGVIDKQVIEGLGMIFESYFFMVLLMSIFY